MPKMAQHTGKWLLKAPCQPVLIKISISCFTIVWVKIPRRWKKAKMWRFLVFSTEPLTSWTFYLLFMMIIDLKQSIDRRWLFDPVLLFILRWSFFCLTCEGLSSGAPVQAASYCRAKGQRQNSRLLRHKTNLQKKDLRTKQIYKPSIWE